MIVVEFNKTVKCTWTKIRVERIIGHVAKKIKKIQGVIEVGIIGEQRMKNINRSYRGINDSTDVLSFAWQEKDDIFCSDYLGQIFICYPVIKRQAKLFKTTEKKEFSRMLIHGLLHLIGFDHMNKKDAQKMFNLQEQLLEEVMKKV